MNMMRLLQFTNLVPTTTERLEDDDGEFNSEQVQAIAENAVNSVIGSETIEYQREKVNQWS